MPEATTAGSTEDLLKNFNEEEFLSLPIFGLAMSVWNEEESCGCLI